MHKARVKVTLNDDASVALRRLSEVSGESMSSIISGLFDLNLSHVEQMTELLEQAAEIRSQFPEHGRHLLRSAFGHVRDELRELDSSICESENIVYDKITHGTGTEEKLNKRLEICGNTHFSDCDSSVAGVPVVCNSLEELSSNNSDSSAPWQGFYDE